MIVFYSSQSLSIPVLSQTRPAAMLLNGPLIFSIISPSISFPECWNNYRKNYLFLSFCVFFSNFFDRVIAIFKQGSSSRDHWSLIRFHSFHFFANCQCEMICITFVLLFFSLDQPLLFIIQRYENMKVHKEFIISCSVHQIFDWSSTWWAYR